MKMRAAVVASAALLTLAGTTSAQAAPLGVDITPGRGPHVCPDERLCLYEHGAFNEGQLGLVPRTDQDISFLGHYGFNDKTNAVINNTDHTVRLYYDRDFGLEYLVLAPGQARDLVDTNWNDDVSSVELL
ncbi:peptidase inhibitor family I36 protein [Streptomyces chrestomyceticus]|uniref:peptidase inhibitor family I36 protein n=1 Tax=Streptomyces chrestomyceticus TaxID=68185 RepID=UPI0033F6577F